VAGFRFQSGRDGAAREPLYRVLPAPSTRPRGLLLVLLAFQWERHCPSTAAVCGRQKLAYARVKPLSLCAVSTLSRRLGGPFITYTLIYWTWAEFLLAANYYGLAVFYSSCPHLCSLFNHALVLDVASLATLMIRELAVNAVQTYYPNLKSSKLSLSQ
jgi:hypothetical protein